MKKIFLLTIVLSSIISFKISALTNVPSGSVSGTWTLTGSPYLIQGNILILNDSTLTIQPGVTVNFQGAFKFNIQGRLLAVGTLTDTITFTAANTANGWKGIRFDNTPSANDTSKITFCKIQNGKATGSSPDFYGGAIYFNNVSKTIVSKCRIFNCKGYYGAGIYCSNYNCSPIISDNIISNNTNISGGGGAIYCDYGSSPTISYNKIFNNSAVGAGNAGGGITCTGSSPAITGNTITYNTTEMNGGGINCSGCGAVISNNIISNNTASAYSGDGGGIYCGSISHPSFKGNFIYNNSAIKGGGIFFTSSANALISDDIICNNTASASGGGIYCESGSIPIIQNSTITNNSAVNGGSLYCIGSSHPVFRNCVLFGNTASTSGAEAFLDDEASDPDFFYCDVLGGSGAFDVNGNYYSGIYQNNININPLFVSPSGGSGQSFNGGTADWSLQNNSPCIDAGDPNDSTSGLDIAGNPRLNVCRIDMGAYEYQIGIPFAVSLNISHPIPCHLATGELEAIVISGTGPYTYLWSDGQTTEKAAGLTAGDYSVTVSQAAGGCSITKSITLPQTWTILIYPDAGPDKTIICGGTAQLDLTLNYTGTGTPTFIWEPSTGLNNDTIYNPTSTVTSSTKYSVTVTTPNGCIRTDSVMVFVDSLTVNAGIDKTIICDGTGQLDYAASNYTGTGPLLYKWSPAVGLNYDTIPNPILTLTNDTAYMVRITTQNGCTAFDSVKVFVNPLTISASSSIIMCGDSAVLSTSTNYTGNDSLTYSWVPAAALNSSTIANPLAYADSNQTYSVTVQTPNGCAAGANVNVMPSSMNAPEICIAGVDSSNKNLIVWNKALSAAIDSFYIFRETNISNAYQKIGTVSYDSMSVFADVNSYPSVQSNKYKISIKDKCGLESNTSTPHKTMHLSINQGMGTSWNLIWDPYQGFTVSTYNVYRGTVPDNLQLIGTSSGSNTQYTDLTPPAGYLYYQVEVVSPSFCNPTRSYNSSRSNISTNNPSGITDYSAENELFSIYPNPSDGNITIEILSSNKGEEILIYNLQGQIILQQILQEEKTVINVSAFSKGIYFIEMKTGKGIAFKKLIKK